jgi:hypothetical protein
LNKALAAVAFVMIHEITKKKNPFFVTDLVEDNPKGISCHDSCSIIEASKYWFRSCSADGFCG